MRAAPSSNRVRVAADARRLSTLQWALLASVAVHGALLALRLGAPHAFNRVFEDTPLAVVLVNRHGAEAPRRPQALAQVALDGGGNARRGLRATPLPDTPRQAEGEALQDSSRALALAQQRQRQLLTQVRSQMVQLQQLAAQTDSRRAAQALQQRRRRLLDLLGAIERRIAQDNAGPRRRFVGPRTRSVPYALYYDRMRQKIEHRGTVDFPQLRGRKLYGRLIMAITVDARGRLLHTRVVRGSGDAALDRMARSIVAAAQPFGAFNAAMRAGADQIVIVAGFDFTRDDSLQTMMQGRP